MNRMSVLLITMSLLGISPLQANPEMSVKNTSEMLLKNNTGETVEYRFNFSTCTDPNEIAQLQTRQLSPGKSLKITMYTQGTVSLQKLLLPANRVQSTV